MKYDTELVSGLPVKGALLDIYRSKGIGHKVETPLDCTVGLSSYLDKAKTSIVFGIYSLTSKEIAHSLAEAHRRGVKLTGVADNVQWAGHFSLCPWLLGLGIDIVRAVHQHACMHLKVAVIDEHICALGSFNWTKNAQEHNDECLLVFDSPQTAAILTEQIMQARKLNGG